MTLNFLSRAAAALLLLAAAAGCGSDKKTYPVAGRFVWPDGTPAKEMAGGTVIFQCDGEQMTAKGAVDPDGRFVLGTYRQDDGSVAGTHKVAVVQPSADYGDNPPLQVVDKKYESPKTSDLVATVEPKANDLVLTVHPGAFMLRKKPK